MHLLDTDVLLALGMHTRATPEDQPLLDWAASQMPSTLFISVVTLIDLEGSAARLDRKERVRSEAIRGWLDGKVRPAFADRILPVDDAAVKRWSHLAYPELREGLLAATALEQGLVIATGHPPSFKLGKVKTVNPWAYAPEAELDWRQAAQSPPQWLKSLFVRA